MSFSQTLQHRVFVRTRWSERSPSAAHKQKTWNANAGLFFILGCRGHRLQRLKVIRHLSYSLSFVFFFNRDQNRGCRLRIRPQRVQLTRFIRRVRAQAIGTQTRVCCFHSFMCMLLCLFLLWCHTCNSECLRCCCWRWRWWRWFRLKDEYISVYSFLLFTWLPVHWTHATLRLCTKSVKRDEAFEERPSFGRRAKESERATLTGKDTEHENNTAHEPQITSVHHRYLRRLFYVLKFSFIFY